MLLSISPQEQRMIMYVFKVWSHSNVSLLPRFRWGLYTQGSPEKHAVSDIIQPRTEGLRTKEADDRHPSLRQRMK